MTQPVYKLTHNHVILTAVHHLHVRGPSCRRHNNVINLFLQIKQTIEDLPTGFVVTTRIGSANIRPHYNMSASDYTPAEMFQILGLNPDEANMFDVQRAAAEFIHINPNRRRLFEDITHELNRYLLSKQSSDWAASEYLPNASPNQAQKITTRDNNIVDVYDDPNNHYPMKQAQIGVQNTVQLPVAQDTLNPTLKNTIFRPIKIDSRFRTSSNSDTSSNFTCDLDDPLVNVLNITLYSVQIPTTWYAFDTYPVDNTRWVVLNKSNLWFLNVPAGNYTYTTLLDAINFAFTDAGFLPPVDAPSATPAIFTAASKKFSFQLNGFIDPTNVLMEGATSVDTWNADLNPEIIFYDPNIISSTACHSSNNNHIDQTFGWTIGFRSASIPVLTSPTQADGAANIYGTSTFTIAIDDFNHNKVNTGLISVGKTDNISLPPTYFNYAYIPKKCITPPNSFDLLQDYPINIVDDKPVFLGNPIPQVIPSYPRSMPANQIYATNQILLNQYSNTQITSSAINIPDTFAVIPIKMDANKLISSSEPYVDFSGSLSSNKRIYFGPVNIKRLQIRLYDDWGKLVNLNYTDWSFVFMAEILYQY